MRGTSIIAFAALLMTTDARPDGYGVKGGRSYKSTANAVASAHAHAGTGSLASASSSAIATADSRGYGASNAIASADASANAGTTEKDVGDKVNGYANGLIDSDDLRHSNDHGGDTEYKCINHGTASWNQRNPDAGQVTPVFDGEDSGSMEQGQGYVGCGSEAVNGGASKDGTGTPCKDKTFGVDDGSAEKGQSTQTIDASHSSGPCVPGDSKCSAHKPGTSSPYPAHGSTPDSPAGSSSTAEIKGGYGGNIARPGMIDRSHAASPCDPENPKCYVHKPAVSNSYSTLHKYSDSSAGSSASAEIKEDHVTNHGKPETIGGDLPGKMCAPGDWKCLTHQPADSHTQFGGKPDVSAGLPSPASIDVGHGGYSTESGKPEGASNPSATCAPGATCISHKPTVSSPRPTYGGTQDWQHPTGSSGHGDKNKIPGAPGASTCAPGDSKCFAHKPSVSNPYPTYVEKPDLSAGSSSPKVTDGGYGGVETSGATGQSDHLGSIPCAPWDSNCSTYKPTVSNLPAFDIKNPSYDSQHSEGTVLGYGGHTSTAGSIGGSHSGSPCAAGDPKCSSHKPAVSNLPASYDKNLSYDSQHSGGAVGGYGGHTSTAGSFGGSHSGSPCAIGDSKCSSHKPAVSNLPAFDDKNLSYDSQHSGGAVGGYGGHTSTAGSFGGSHSGSPCAIGDSKCSSHKPAVSNLPAFDDKNLSYESQHSGGAVGGYGDHTSTAGSIWGSHSGSPCAIGDSKCSSHKPAVSNLPAFDDKNLSYDSQHSGGAVGGYGGHTSTAGSFGGSHLGSPCATGDSKCSSHKPAVSSLPASYDKNPSYDSQHSEGTVGGYGGHTSMAGSLEGSHSGSPCATGDSKCSSHKPAVSNLPAFDDKNLSYDSQHSGGAVGGYGGHTSTAGSFGGSHSGRPCATGDLKCSAHKPSVPTIHSVYETKPVTWTPTSDEHSHPDKVASHYPSSGRKPGTSNPFLNGQIDLSSLNRPSSPGKPPGQKINPSNPFLYPHNQAHPQTSQIRPVAAAPQHPQGSFPGGSGFPQVRPKPPNPFLSQSGYAHPMSGVKHPATDVAPGHEEKDYTIINGSPNTDCHGSVSCAPNKPSTHFPVPPTYPQGISHQSPGYTEIKPNPSNPFLSHHASGDKSAGSTGLEVGSQDNRYPHIGSQPTSTTPGKDCHKSVPSSTNEPADILSGNPFLTNHRQKNDDHSTSGHASTQFPDTQPDNGPLASKPVGGHQTAATDGGKPGTGQGCGISSVLCNQVPIKMGHQSSIGGGLQSSSTIDRNDHGVKGHRAGVKGGPRQPEHPIRLQGSSALGEDDHVSSEQKPSAESIANASAHSTAHASSSSSVAGAQSHASASSEAHSSNGGHGSSSAWSSSNASASAFASSHSSIGSYHGWTEAGLPEVPAQ